MMKIVFNCLLVLVFFSLCNVVLGQQNVQSTGFVPWGQVVTFGDNGVSKGTLVADNDSSRGEALKSRVDSAVDGDTVYVGPGTFALGNNTLDLSIGGTGKIHLRGAGRDTTKITSTSTDGAIVKPGTGSRVSDIAIVGVNVGSTQLPFGSVDSANDPASTDVVLSRAYISAERDGIYYSKTGTACELLMHDVEIESRFDCVFTGGADHQITAIGCITKAENGVSNQCRTWQLNTGTTRIFGGVHSAIDGGSSANTVIRATGTSVVEVFGARLISTNTGAATPYHVYVATTGSITIDAATNATQIFELVGTLQRFSVSGVSTTSAGRALWDDADASAQRTTMGVAIGSDVQAYDADLAALAGLTSAADKVPYFTGSGTASVADLPSFGRTLIANTTAALARSDLGVNTRSFEIIVFPRSASVAVQNPAGEDLLIPSEINGWDLTDVEAFHDEGGGAGTSGTTTIQLDNSTNGDMLSTPLTIDFGEDSSTTAAAAHVINTSSDDVATNELITPVVTAIPSAGTPQGLRLRLTFTEP